MIDKLTQKYSLSKTLRFKLIPQGQTEAYVAQEILEDDLALSVAYQEMKKIIDRYHVSFIDEALNQCALSHLCEYAALYATANKTDKEIDAQNKLEIALRKEIAGVFSKHEKFAKLFKKEFIKEELPAFVQNAAEQALVAKFAVFTSYFTGFYENRKNMYSADEKATAISYRIVNENLPKFLDNVKAFQSIAAHLPQETLDTLQQEISPLYNVSIQDVFTPDYFNMALSQQGIDRYNQILGGYTTADGVKVQGLNEYINLFHQANKEIRLPRLKMLYKQILSDRTTLSFIPEKFENDQASLQAILDFYTQPIEDVSYQDCVQKAHDLLCSLSEYDLSAVFVKNGAPITEISNMSFGIWSHLSQAIQADYDNAHMKKPPKDLEKYQDTRRKALKRIENYSLATLQTLGDASGEVSIVDKLKEKVLEVIANMNAAYANVSPLLTSQYPEDKKLIKDDASIEKIKAFLDSLKELQHLLTLLAGSKNEPAKDARFYGEFENLLARIKTINPLYDMVRNYMTQKPYSTDKFKLNFSHATLLDGWDKNKEEANLSLLFRKDGLYFLGIMNKKHNRSFRDIPTATTGDCYEKMEYKLLPGPNKMLPKVFLSKLGIETYHPSEEILAAYAKGTHKKGEQFNLADCHRLIDYFKASIALHPDWKNFGFTFSDTALYPDISFFYKEVADQGYKLNFVTVDTSYIDGLVAQGELYLFQLYNKDFSAHSKGTPNLHTLYFKALFAQENLDDVVYKLNGQAEVFYRPASITASDRVLHPKNQPITNKNPHNPQKQSEFSYDIIKDRRFTKQQFSFHLPITINFKAPNRAYLNDEVRLALKNAKKQHIIGIDRGERHLLYISVINENAEIVEQYSLNEIINAHKGVAYTTDYHQLLDEKEKDRQTARKNWKTIDNIKDLKEGYISQVVHKICQLVEQYDAIIAMEDLNSGFKNSRIKVEKQVYQKFEKMLIDKLSFYANKSKQPLEAGGILRAYQLTNPFESFKKMSSQNGIIFYIPAWLTSKIDPATGFVDLLKPKYTSIAASKEFFGKFDAICFVPQENLFAFDFDYTNFPKGVTDYRKKWTVCTNGERIRSFRNHAKNNEWDTEIVPLTQAMVALFTTAGISYQEDDLKAQILAQNDATFFKELTHLLQLTLQMRNSITGSTVDYLISPVKDCNGNFYCSNDYAYKNAPLPDNADANGAYHIAKKALWVVQQIQACHEDIRKVKVSISNQEWLAYTQQ